MASTTTHHTQIYINGKLTYNWPISTGRADLPTPDGSYLSVEKANPVRMIGGGAPGSAGYYDELVNYAVRFTFSGDYYHSAPWSVVNQGTSNVSHGCVNLPPEDAVTYYNLSIPGNPITITASTAAGKWDDGWTEWFLTWPQYLKGSALGLAVQAGTSGQHVRRARHAARGHRHRAAGHVGGRQLLRRHREHRLSGTGRPWPWPVAVAGGRWPVAGAAGSRWPHSEAAPGVTWGRFVMGADC